MTRRMRHAARFEETAQLGLLARIVMRVSESIPLRWFGVDRREFRLLLNLELVLEERRRRSAQAEGAGGIGAAGPALQFFMYLVFGGFASAGIAVIDDPFWGVGIALGIAMFLLTMSLVADYLPALVDTAEIEVIAPLPVDDRAVLAARVTHVLGYLGLAMFALSLFPLVIGSVWFGVVFLPAWILAAVLGTATCVGLAVLLFLVAMRVFDLDRFRDALLYLQVGSFVVLMGGAQIGPRLIDFDAVGGMLDDRPWWLVAVPPFHGAAWLSILRGEVDAMSSVLALLGVLVPAAAFFAVASLAKRGFLAQLAVLATASKRGTIATRPRRPWRDWLLRSPEGRAGYDFFTALSRRERGFRMRTYPMIVLSAVLGIAFGFRGRSGAFEFEGMLCGAIYMLAIYAPAIVLQARFSDNHEARWVFAASPARHLGRFLVGGMCAMFIGFLLPVAVVMTLLVLWLGGATIAPDALFALESVAMSTLASMLLFGKHIPFTERMQKNAESTNTGLMLLAMCGISVWIGVHVLARQFDAVFVALLVVQPIAVLMLFARLRRLRPSVGWLRGA